MPQLKFASEPLYKADTSRTTIVVSEHVSRALIEILDGKPLTAFTTDHLGAIVALANANANDTGLQRLADAIVAHKRVFIGFS